MFCLSILKAIVLLAYQPICPVLHQYVCLCFISLFIVFYTLSIYIPTLHTLMSHMQALHHQGGVLSEVQGQGQTVPCIDDCLAEALASVPTKGCAAGLAWGFARYNLDDCVFLWGEWAHFYAHTNAPISPRLSLSSLALLGFKIF